MTLSKRFFRFYFLAAFLFALVLPVNSQERRSDDFAEIRPRSHALDELTVVFPRAEVELDFRRSIMLSEAQIFTAIYEGLFSYHPITMQPVRALASRAELSEDRRQWTFTIRENARFNNGDPVRAQDFKASWFSMIDPRRNAPYSSLFDIIEGARDYRLGIGSAENVGISAPNDRTLVVRLNSPAAFFPSMLCHHAFSPIHPSMLNEENWRRPISNGPFYIADIDDDHILLNKNHKYWDADRVSLNRIIIRFADADEASALWNSGEAHWIKGNFNYRALTDLSGIEVHALFATHYYFIRSAREPWNDFRLRRALSLALPWEEIRPSFLPARTLINPIGDYPRIDGIYTTNLEEAKRLMAEAGFPGGIGLPELVIRITPSRDAEIIALHMIEAWYGSLGVPVRVEVIPFADYIDALNDDDYDVGFITWVGNFADPFTFLKMWCRDSNLNLARHDDSDFQALLDRSMNEEGLTRLQTLAEAEALLLYRGNVLPISFAPAINIIDLVEIEGWFPTILGIHPFKYMGIRARRPLPGVVMLR